MIRYLPNIKLGSIQLIRRELSPMGFRGAAGTAYGRCFPSVEFAPIGANYPETATLGHISGSKKRSGHWIVFECLPFELADMLSIQPGFRLFLRRRHTLTTTLLAGPDGELLGSIGEP